MRVLSPLNRKKKGLSDVVGYVLLIVIAVALSVLIYAWLKFFVEEGGFNIDDIERCSENVGVIIKNQGCVSESGDVDLNLTLKNQGLFNVSGFIVRVNNRSGAESGFYLLEVNNTLLVPGQEINVSYDLGSLGVLGNVTLVEVQPFLKEGGDEISCASYVTQEVSCSAGVVGCDPTCGVGYDCVAGVCEYCGDGDLNGGEVCDEGTGNGDGVDSPTDADSYDCSNDCQLIVYNGMEIGETFTEYNEGEYGIIELSFIAPHSKAVCKPAVEADNCYIYGPNANLTLKTPEILVAGSYNVSYNVSLSGSSQPNEDYGIICGGETFIEDDNGEDDAGFHIRYVVCNFLEGENKVIFKSLSTNLGQSVHFYHLDIRGPI